MLVVTGATGALGRAIVLQLLERHASGEIAVSVRDPEKARDLAELGIRVRRGDFAEPPTLAHAFEGASQLLLVSSNAASYGGDPIAQHRSVIDAARVAGVRRIVYTSHMAASSRSAFPPMVDHDATEAMLAGSGLAWTALRNGFYAASGLLLMGDFVATGRIDAPEDGNVSWTAHADLAEAAAIVLTGEGRYDGPTPPLTASQALDLGDLAQIASERLGRPITRHVRSDDDLRAAMIGRGMPIRAIDVVLGLYRASRAAEFATVDPTLRHMLGRNPSSMRDLIAKTIG